MAATTTTTGKIHWCGWCCQFVREKIIKQGYWATPKIVCPYCQRTLGTPE